MTGIRGQAELWAYGQNTGSPAAKLILILMGRVLDKTPSLKTSLVSLAVVAECTSNETAKAIQDLEAKLLIQRVSMGVDLMPNRGPVDSWRINIELPGQPRDLNQNIIRVTG